MGPTITSFWLPVHNCGSHANYDINSAVDTWTDHPERQKTQGGRDKYGASHLKRGDLNQHRRLPQWCGGRDDGEQWFHIDSTDDTGRAMHTYKVCEAGTMNCSNQVTVRFRQ